MRTLTSAQIKLIHSALVHYALQEEDTINQHFFEDDNSELITETKKSLQKIQDMQKVFSTEKNLYLMTESEYLSIQTCFNRVEDIHNKEKNYIKKSGVFLGLLHSIKHIIENKN